MIILKQVKTVDGRVSDVRIPSAIERTVDAQGLLLIPGLIDTHISLGSSRRPGWASVVESAVKGGVTAVIDIPSESAPTTNQEELTEKKELARQRLVDLGMPLRHYLYSQAHSAYEEEAVVGKTEAVGSLILFNPGACHFEETLWETIFRLAAWRNIPVVINAANEQKWEEARFGTTRATLLEKSIHYAEKRNTRLYVLNVGSKEELDLIEKARSRALLIYAETTPLHLFSSDESCADFLWEAIASGKIEIIGSGYAAESPAMERLVVSSVSFDFSDPAFLLPLLFTAYSEGKIALDKVICATRANVYDLFELDRNDADVVLVNPTTERSFQRVGIHGSRAITLKGWPEYTIAGGQVIVSG